MEEKGPSRFDLNSGTSLSVGEREKGSEVPRPQTEGPELEEPSYKTWTRQQVLPCLAIYAGMVAQLVCLMMIGPGLLDLQLLTDTNIEQSSWFLSARAMGALVGAIILSYTMELRYFWFALTGALFLSGLAFIIIPWVSIFPAVIVLFVIMGVGMGYFMTGGMLSVFSIWPSRKDGVSWLNGGQLMFLVGGIMGPLIIKPFFAAENNGTMLIVPGAPSSDQPSDLPANSQTYIQYAYLIGGLLVCMSCVLFLLVWRVLGGVALTLRMPGPRGRHAPRTMALRCALIVVLFLFHIVTAVIVRTFAAYLVTFTVNYLSWSKEQGTVLTSVLFLGALLSKFICIFLVRVLATELQLFCGLLINIFASLLLVFLIDYSPAVMWVCSLLIAVGDANITATILAWTDSYMGIRGIVGALYNIGGTVGEIVAAPLVGWLFMDVSYVSFLYMIALATLANLLFMCMLQGMGMKYRSMVQSQEAQGDEAQSQGAPQGVEVSVNERTPILGASHANL